MIWLLLFKVAGSTFAVMVLAALIEEMDVNPTATEAANKMGRILFFGMVIFAALGAMAWIWGL